MKCCIMFNDWLSKQCVWNNSTLTKSMDLGDSTGRTIVRYSSKNTSPPYQDTDNVQCRQKFCGNSVVQNTMGTQYYKPSQLINLFEYIYKAIKISRKTHRLKMRHLHVFCKIRVLMWLTTSKPIIRYWYCSYRPVFEHLSKWMLLSWR